MTKSLSSFGELATILSGNLIAAMAASEAGLEQAAKIVQDDAQGRIGHYQAAVGPFQDWAPLADSTEEEKSRLGYPLDAPLLREGQLRDSIVTEHSALEAVIGSKSPVAAYQEFGTETIPPRPFLGPAAFTNREKIREVIGTFTVAGLIGSGPIHPALGYDQAVK